MSPAFDRGTRRRWLARLAAFALAIGLWQVAAMLVGEGILLPAPTAVCLRFLALLAEPGFFPVFLTSTGGILLGFLSGLVAGCVLALLASLFPVLEVLFFPYMITVRSVPVASFIVLALVWLDAGELSGFISFLIVLPLVYNSLLAALRVRSRELDEMAAVFHVSFFSRLRYIWVPQLRAPLQAAAETGIGLAWKSGVAAELIGLADGTIGDRIYLSKLYLDTAGMFAWTLVILLGSLLCERLVVLGLRLLLGGKRVCKTS